MKTQSWKCLRLTLVVASMLLLTVSCSLVKPSEESQTSPPAVETPKPKPPSAEKDIQTGIAQLESGQLNKAIASFQKALKIEPNNAQASQYLQEAENRKEQLITEHLHQGIEYFTGEQLQDAMGEWEAVLALDSENAEALKYKKRTQTMLDALGK